METKKEKKEKKEKKFNSERTEKQVRNAIKEAFPNESFHVSSFVERVEVLYPTNSKITAAEINIFKVTLCSLLKIKKEELAFVQYEMKKQEAPKQAA